MIRKKPTHRHKPDDRKEFHRLFKRLGEIAVLMTTQHKTTLSKINSNETKLKNIMSKQQDLAAELETITAQVAKIGTETTKTLEKVAELEAALANQDNVSPELQSAFDALKTQVQATDDLIADA